MDYPMLLCEALRSTSPLRILAAQQSNEDVSNNVFADRQAGLSAKTPLISYQRRLRILLTMLLPEDKLAK